MSLQYQYLQIWIRCDRHPVARFDWVVYSTGLSPLGHKIINILAESEKLQFFFFKYCRSVLLLHKQLQLELRLSAASVCPPQYPWTVVEVPKGQTPARPTL